MGENHNKRTMFTLITSLGTIVVSVLIGFFLSPYMVANFGEEANGFGQLANNFVSYASLITIALNSMASRFISIAYHKKEYELCNKYYSSIIVGNLVITLTLFIPAVFCIIKLDSLINIQTVNAFHVKLLFAFVFFEFFLSLVNGVLSIATYVRNAQYIQNTMQMIKTLIRSVGLIFLFSAFTPRLYYVSLISFIITMCTFPVLFYFKKRLLPEVRFDIKQFDIKTVWTLVSSGIWNTVTQCGNLLMTGLDLLLSNLFISPVQMGVLSIAKAMPTYIIHLGTSVNASFSPNLTIAYASDDKQKILMSLRYAMKCSSLLMSIPIMALCVYGKNFYSLWVPSMNAGQLTLLSLLTCMSFIPFAGTQTLYNVYTTTNKLKLNSITVLVGGVINFVVVYFLLKFTNLGLIAVAGTSSVISMIRNLCITVPYIAKVLKLKWYTFYKDVLISCLCCAINGVCCLICNQIIMADSWLMLILSCFVACVLSLICSGSILLNKDEKKMLVKKLLRR